MNRITSIGELERLYNKPVARAVTKVSAKITPLYQEWINASRFLVIATVGKEGCDASPRGDLEDLVKIQNPKTIWIPDWRGNNRLDSLRNIVTDGRLSLMFMVNGCNNVVRVNGHAELTSDSEFTNAFLRNDKHPRTVIVVNVLEIYFQCAKALMRSDLWNPETRNSHLPTAGQFIREQDESFDALSYDSGYKKYAKTKLW